MRYPLWFLLILVVAGCSVFKVKGKVSLEPNLTESACTLTYEDTSLSLLGTFGEVVAGQGLDHRGDLLQVFVNPKTQDWTVILHSPSGLTCVADFGVGWEYIIFRGDPV